MRDTLIASILAALTWMAAAAAVLVTKPAYADALPSGATTVSGSVTFVIVGSDAVATLLLEIPKGRIFVLTDLEVADVRFDVIRRIQIFGPEDPNNPRFQGLTKQNPGFHGDYQRSFQTGLVFSGAPTIKIVDCTSEVCDASLARASFSGYFNVTP